MRFYIKDDLIMVIGKEKNEVSHKHYPLHLIIASSPININGEEIFDSIVIGSNVEHIGYFKDQCCSLLISPETMYGTILSEKCSENGFYRDSRTPCSPAAYKYGFIRKRRQ